MESLSTSIFSSSSRIVIPSLDEVLHEPAAAGAKVARAQLDHPVQIGATSLDHREQLNRDRHLEYAGHRVAHAAIDVELAAGFEMAHTDANAAADRSGDALELGLQVRGLGGRSSGDAEKDERYG